MSRLTIIMMLFALAGCEATNLHVVHHTVVGVNAAVSSDQTAGHVIVGYDRNFNTIIPKSVKDSHGNGNEAMSALSCSEVEVDGIFLTKFQESLATGTAAIQFAQALKNNKDKLGIFDCLDDPDSSGN